MQIFQEKAEFEVFGRKNMGSLEGSKFEICPSFASVLAMGTANPPTCYTQEEFPQVYALITGSEDMVYIEKLKEIGEKACVKKRYISLNLDYIQSNPNIVKHMTPSMDARQDFGKEIIPQLAKKAAIEAITEWGRPVSEITHLVFCTFSALQMPGMDYKLATLLNLNPTVKRTMLYLQGCYGGGAALRVAKDLAENNDGSRVLVVCCELIIDFFHGPPPHSNDTTIGGSSSMVQQAIFADGAAAAIIGKYDPNDINRINEHPPLFQLVSTFQRFIPDTENDMSVHVCEVGQILHLSKRIPSLISENVEKTLVEGFSPLRIDDWNSIFWITHPGGPSILKRIESKLELEKDKLRISWDVLRNYGNMSSPTIMFVLNETRKRSVEEGKTSTGLGLEYGVLLTFGPGLTMETIVLKSVSI